MIQIKYRRNGFIIRLESQVDIEEVGGLRQQMRDEWAGMDENFVLLIDARQFKVFTADAQAGFQTFLEEADEQGLLRITVLGISTALANLFCSIMVQIDLMEKYQFLDLAYESDWQKEMKSWLDEPFSEDEE